MRELDRLITVLFRAQERAILATIETDMVGVHSPISFLTTKLVGHKKGRQELRQRLLSSGCAMRVISLSRNRRCRLR